MIGYDDLRRITKDVTGLPAAPTNEANSAYWSARGVDYSGLHRFCDEDGNDTLRTIVPAMLLDMYGPVAAGEDGQLYAGLPLEALPSLMASIASMSEEIGFLLGWRAYELAMGKPPTVAM